MANQVLFDSTFEKRFQNVASPHTFVSNAGNITGTIGNNTFRLLLVFVGCSVSKAAMGTVAMTATKGGVPTAMTLIGSLDYAVAGRSGYLFGLIAPDVGNCTLSWSFTGSPTQSCYIGAVSLYHADNVTGWRNFGTDIGTSTHPAGIVTSLPGNMGVVGMSADNALDPVTIHAGEGTLAWQDNIINTTTGMGYKLSAGNVVTVGLDLGSSVEWGVLKVDVIAKIIDLYGAAGCRCVGGPAFASDGFDGPASTDLGSSWTPNGASSFQIIADGNGIAQAIDRGGDAAERYSGIAWPRDQRCRIIIDTLASGAVDTGYGCCLRMNADGTKSYYRYVVGANGWELRRFDPTVGPLVVGFASRVFADGDTIDVWALGGNPTRFRMLQNNVEFSPGLQDASSPLQSGSVGVVHSSTTQAGSTVGIKYWEGGGLIAELTTSIRMAAAATCKASTTTPANVAIDSEMPSALMLNGTGATRTLTFTNSAGTLLLVAVDVTTAGDSFDPLLTPLPAITGVTANGVAMTLVPSSTVRYDSAGAPKTELTWWMMENPPVGTFDIVITPSQNAYYDLIYGAISLRSVQLGASVGNVQTSFHATNATTTSVNLAGTLSSSLLLALIAAGASFSSFAQTISASKNVDGHTGGNNAGMTRVVGGGLVSMLGTHGSDIGGASALEVFGLAAGILSTSITLLAAPSGVCTVSASLATVSRFAATPSCVCSASLAGGNYAASATGKASTSATLVVSTVWTDAGFNFRATAGYVADGALEAVVVGHFFPHFYSINGITVTGGWTGSGPTRILDENAALDRRLAGVNGKVNDGQQIAFKVRLPQAGNWRIFFALGEATLLEAYQYLQILDGANVLATYDKPAGTALGNWYAPDNVIYDSTTWPATGAGKFFEGSFADVGDGTALVTIVIGTPVAAADPTLASTLAHLRLLVSPNQGPILDGMTSVTCSTLATIAQPLSALAQCVCSGAGELGANVFVQASGVCSTAVDLTTSITVKTTASGICSVTAPLTTTPLTLAGRAGGSCSIPTQADTLLDSWDVNPAPDLAGYKVKYGTSPGVYSTILDVGLLRPNVLIQSDDLANAAWTKEGARIEPGCPASDGSLTGFELIQLVNTGYHRHFQTATSLPAGTYTASAILKQKVNSTLAMVRLFADAFHSYAAEFDLANGVPTPGSDAPYPGTTAKMTDLGNGFYLCEVNGAILAGPASIYVEINNAAHAGQYAGDATSSILVSSPMLTRNILGSLYVGTLAVPQVGYLIAGLTPGLTYYTVSTAYDNATPPNEAAPTPEGSKFMPWGLKTAVSLAAHPTCACSTSVNLRNSGALFFGATSSCVMSVTAPLTANIQFATSTSGVCSTSATMGAGIAQLMAASATCKAATTAGLTTAITNATSARGFASTISFLGFPGATFAGSATGVCSVVAPISTAITFLSQPAGICATAAALTTAIRMAAATSGVCSTSATLSSVNVILGAPSCKCTVSAALTTAIRMAAVSSAAVSVSSLLTINSTIIVATSGAFCATIGRLQVPFTSTATGTCSTSATLSGFHPTIFDNVQERFAERGIERGIFTGGG